MEIKNRKGGWGEWGKKREKKRGDKVLKGGAASVGAGEKEGHQNVQEGRRFGRDLVPPPLFKILATPLDEEGEIGKNA